MKKRILFLTEATYLNTGYSTYGKEVIDRVFKTGKYDVAEFSIYGSPDDERRKTIPWKNYPNLPAMSDSKEVQAQYNSNPANQFGAWRFERVCNDFKPDIVVSIRDFWMDSFVKNSPYRKCFKWCFPSGTPVINDFGYSTNIEDVKIGDKVLTHKNNKKLVTNISNHKYHGLMVKVKAEGMAEPLICTEDHEILSIKKPKRIWNNDLRKYELVINSININESKFVPASDLSIGDYLMIPIGEFGEGLPNLSEEDCWIIGFFLADGCATDKGRISFAFHKDETETLKRVTNYFKSKEITTLFKIKTPEGEKKESSENGITWRLNNSNLQNYFSDFYQDAKKVLPIKFQNLNKNQSKQLLDGYFSGDGCKTITNHGNPSIEMFSDSKILARQIADIARKLGYPIRLNSRDNGYTLRMSNKKCKDFDKELKNINSCDSKKEYTRSLIKDGYFLMPIFSIESYEDSLSVYDIEVEDDSSFITHCAVHNCWMPTVDAEPQNEEWISYMTDCDAITTYSDWAINVIKSQCGDKAKIKYSTPPAASPLFKPVEDKESHKQKMGLDPSSKFIGFVSRNQRRKLFPELFEGFAKFLEKTGRTDVYLYCHTSYPDNGWDLARLLIKHGISSRVLFTYVCQNCNTVMGCHFSDALQECPNCKHFSSKPSSVSVGVSTKQLSDIYNCFDLYIQCANSEGFGIGQVEAAACGVPVCAVDYSAMSDIVRKLNGYPIKLKTTYEELETGCLRAIPDVEYISNVFEQFFSLSEEEVKEEKLKTLNGYSNNYNWDVTAKKWMDIFDELEKGKWDLPIVKTVIPEKFPENIDNYKFLEWSFSTMFPELDIIGSFEFSALLRDLNFLAFRNSPCGFFYSENSFLGRESYQPFDRNIAFNMIKSKATMRNFWEDVRAGNIKFNKENWID